MTPLVRRSNRIKRRTALESQKQSPTKRARRTPSSPQPSNHTPFKANRLPRTPKQKDRAYRPCEETVFLTDDYHSLHWVPPPTKKTSGKESLAVLREFNFDAHKYFTSVRAATQAALAKMFMYRHVGSIFLEGFKLAHKTKAQAFFQSIATSKESLVNINKSLRAAKMSDTDLLATLVSLTVPSENLWPGPFIVLVAKREEFTNVCNSKKRKLTGITAQVYIGRLLFELIACHDIKVLFEALRPSVPYKCIPQLQSQPQLFSRSPESSEGPEVSFNAILRNAESLGYASLTDEQKQKIGEVLNVKLYPFQEQTVRWMLDMENGSYALNDFFWEERFFNGGKNRHAGSFYYFPLTGELRLRKPPRIRGGMVTEEMGLGKTVEALALIAAQRNEHKPYEVDVWCEKDPKDVIVRDGIISMRRMRQKNNERNIESSLFHHGDEVLNDFPDKDFPKKVKVRRWPPKTTLVVCPRQLIGQWKQEAQLRAPSLSVELWHSETDNEEESTSDADSIAEHSRDTIAFGENAKDVVIVNYSTLRTDHMLSRICWRRLILDEAQMTRRSTAMIALDVFNLRAKSRFLMTGTPIVNSINDLKGELAMLKVWPFTLDNDGFWEQHIQKPFGQGEGNPLLDQLLKVAMIRHTKGQNLGIVLPPRLYQTVEVDLVGSHRASYCYVLGSCLDELEAQGSGTIDTRRLRILMRLLVTICLSPETLDLSSLDLARRFTWSRSFDTSVSKPTLKRSTLLKLQKVSPKEAIEFVAESAGRAVRHTTRSYATNHANMSNELDRFLRMPIEQLRQEVLSRKLMTEGRILKLRRERLAALAAGGVHRLTTDTLQELRETAMRVGIVLENEAKRLSRAVAMAKLQQHYDLLNGIERTRTVHESGFSAITKIMEHKGNPNCPVCLMECDDRVTVTKCGHIYCFDCIILMLESSSNYVRCAICRREVTAELVVEITRPTLEIQTKEENGGALIAKDEDVWLCDSVSRKPKHPAENGKAKGQPTIYRSGEASNEIQSCLCHEAVENLSKPTAEDAWNEYEQLGEAPSRFHSLGGDPRFPSLDARFLRHLAAIKEGLESPKLSALHSLIRSCPNTTKFCVVAASVGTLRLVRDYLEEKGINCVGAGVPLKRRQLEATDASSEFRENPNVRVFLLNPTNASGLTLIAAEYVIFMETLVRVADEVQAAARVHRIGQTKPVKIIRMVARNTIEELMIQQRGEIRSPQEESEVLSAVNTRDASDKFILDLLRDDD